jgi:hypothetical protein
MEITAFFLEGRRCGVYVRAHGLPNRPTIMSETHIVDAFLMRFGRAIDQGISRPEGMILDPNRVEESVVSITQTHSNI